MYRQPKILAGTALGLLMACGPLAAMPLPAPSMAQETVPLVLAEESRGAEVLKKRRAEKTREKAQERGEEAAESEKKSEQPGKRRVKREDEILKGTPGRIQACRGTAAQAAGGEGSRPGR
ncbi:hypothetical protein ACG873_24505 [Mesorhizobium sp. AaZ16]|uniref:hypothetical protein n=1 Tax=Mesorhizobium sp. AaZ16 TaxID=3402289 RepID=UPI00374F5776